MRLRRVTGPTCRGLNNKGNADSAMTTRLSHSTLPAHAHCTGQAGHADVQMMTRGYHSAGCLQAQPPSASRGMKDAISIYFRGRRPAPPTGKGELGKGRYMV